MQEPGELDIAPRRGLLPFSLVWLVPLVALAVALFISWQAISSRGPLITVTFPSAEGITAGSTVLKYRDVNVGVVEEIAFTDDLQAVEARVRVDKSIAPFVDSDARFWLVRPQVTLRGVTGLGTVLSGVYLEGSWDASPGTPATRFEALPAPPLARDGDAGLRIVLRAETGGRLQAGAPIVLRGITVGSIDTPQLAPDGNSVLAEAFIEAPHDRLITTGTRFWGASGFSIDLGAGGLSLNVASLASLLEGGVEFGSFGEGEPAADGTVFEVYGSQGAARDNALTLDTAGSVPFSVVFDSSLSGLAAGAAVEFRGLRVGTVSGLALVRDAGPDGNALALRADLALSPTQLGLAEDATAEETQAFVADAVRNGVRARLASQGLLSSSLKIELALIPDAAPEELDLAAEPAPRIPTAPPNVSDVAESARGLLGRLQDLPLESLVASVTNLIGSIETVVSSPELQQAPGAVVALIDETRALLGSDEIRQTIGAASASVAELQGLLARVNESEAVPALLAALERSEAIAASLQSTADGLPALLDRIGEVADGAAAVPLQTLADSAAGILEDARALIGSEELDALPAALAASLQNLESATAEIGDLARQVGESGAVDSLVQALQRTDAIAQSLETTVAGLPTLLEDIRAVAAEAGALPLAELTRSTEELLVSANALVASEETARIPAALASALDEVSASLAALREGGAVENTNQTLASARAAADAIAQAADGLPELTARLDRLIVTAEQTTRAYGGQSEFNAQTLGALRDLRDAARAVTSLSRTIERKPNSLIMGR